MQSLSILSEVDPADFIRSDAPISQFARASTGSYDRFILDPEQQQQQQQQQQSRSNADEARLLLGARPSVLETAQAFGGTSAAGPRQFQPSSNLSSSTPQLSAVLPPPSANAAHLIPASYKATTTVKLPSQVLLVFVDGRNGDAVIDRLSNSTAAMKLPLSTGDRLKFIDGCACSNANEALASIQSVNNGTSTDVELDFVSRSGVPFHVVASRQQVQPPRHIRAHPAIFIASLFIPFAVDCIQLLVQNIFLGQRKHNEGNH
jgi:hypothetical protein